MKRVEVAVRNPSGIHARPAAMFVRAAAKFRSAILIRNVSADRPAANAKSMANVLAAGVRNGHVVELSATGEDEEQAVEGLRAAIEAGLGETVGEASERPATSDSALAGASGATPPPPPAREPARPAGGTPEALGATPEALGATPGPPPAATARPSAATPMAPAAATPGPRPATTPAPVAATPSASVPTPPRGASNRLAGLPAAPGIAIGGAWVYAPAPSPAGPTDADREPQAIRVAAGEAARQLDELVERVRTLGRPDDAEIFGAQALMATDPMLLDDAVARAEAGEALDRAVAAAAEAAAAVLAALPDELLAARAADVRDVGARIVRILRGETLDLPGQPSIAVAEDLPPSVTAEIPAGLLLGVALQGGSPTAHAAILARGLGIPAVVGVRGLLDAVAGPVEAELAIDGGAGTVVVAPDERERESLAERASALAVARQKAAATRGTPATTWDGHRVRLLANIGGPADVPRALAAGAEGVGLFRTEFLFMRRQTAPTEAEQVAAYRDVLAAFGASRPVVIRLADIGGDKAIPYLGLPAEANPFLGVRAIRLAYADRTLLRTQLRAILRAGAEAGVTPHVMAPMIATTDDVHLYAELYEEARAGLQAEGLPAAARLERGVMIEIPAAALMADQLAAAVDFFSIGTNDLTQYAMAADRGNAALAGLHDALHPAVLRLIAATVAGADRAGIPVAVCGELAGDPAGALVLVGLGVDELSADAGSLDTVRLVLSGVRADELHDLAERAQRMSSAAEVRAAAAVLVARRTDPD